MLSLTVRRFEGTRESWDSMGDIEVTEADEVTLSLGDTVTVVLRENASTGYVWSVTDVGPGLMLEGNVAAPPGERAPGEAGRRLLQLRAAQAGEWRIGLRLARSWEDDALEVRRIAVTVS